MAITPEDTYTKILDKMKSIFRSEFEGSLPTYVDKDNKSVGSQYIRLEPRGSELVEELSSGQIRQYNIDIYFYFRDKNIKISALEHVLRYTSRIEALVHNNRTATLSDSSDIFNCKIEATELNALEEDNEYVVLLEWNGQHMGNIS